MCCCTSRPVRVLLMVPLAEIWRERPQAEQNMACALLAAPHRSQKRVDESAMHLFFLCFDGILWVRVGCRLVQVYVICQGGFFGGMRGFSRGHENASMLVFLFAGVRCVVLFFVG